MKRTILFTAALATAVSLFAMGAAQASGKSEKGESRNAHSYRILNVTGSGDKYQERNQYTERKEVRTQTRLAPESGWMSPSDLTANLETKGYRVREMKTERYRYVVEMTDAGGRRVEARIDPVTGIFVGPVERY